MGMMIRSGDYGNESNLEVPHEGDTLESLDIIGDDTSTTSFSRKAGGKVMISFKKKGRMKMRVDMNPDEVEEVLAFLADALIKITI